VSRVKIQVDVDELDGLLVRMKVWRDGMAEGELTGDEILADMTRLEGGWEDWTSELKSALN
jgi:hypothetical protein